MHSLITACTKFELGANDYYLKTQLLWAMMAGVLQHGETLEDFQLCRVRGIRYHSCWLAHPPVVLSAHPAIDTAQVKQSNGCAEVGTNTFKIICSKIEHCAHALYMTLIFFIL